MFLKEGDMVYAIYNETAGRKQYRPAIIEEVIITQGKPPKFKCYHLDMTSMEDTINIYAYYESACYRGSELKTPKDLKANEHILVTDFISATDGNEVPMLDATFLRMGDRANECIVKINDEKLIFVWNLAILFI